MTDLGKLAAEVHKNSLAHGWWGPEYTEDVVFSLIHAEWSEALEEYRNNRPEKWHRCRSMAPADLVICERCSSCQSRINGRPYECPDYDAKPEGQAVEIVDGCLRILDAMANYGMKIMVVPRFSGALTLPELVALLHYDTSMAFQYMKTHMPKTAGEYLGMALDLCFNWISAQGFEPEALMWEKHVYNLGRPFKHGGKRI